uniref:Uncharacterized protein n=1 Tax=Cannabis sativa TaxID=3483 RepID=A0A803P128_CANSA
MQDMADCILSLSVEKRNILRLTSGQLPERGLVGDASLRIGPGGQASEGPNRPFPISRGKGKAIVEDSDSFSSNDDDMSSRLRGLIEGPSYEPTGQVRAKVKNLEASLLVKDRAMAEMEALLIERRSMISGLETMLSTRNKENTTHATFISRLESNLAKHEERLRAALEGQQAIREEYVDLSSELTYEFKLCNHRANLSYMGSKAFVEHILARERVLFQSRLEADQPAVYREGSSGNHDEGLADPLAEEVAG